MREIQLRKHTIQLYDSIDEMPVVRYHKFTQLMVLATGEGNDLEAIRTKIDSIVKMIDDGQPAKAKVEMLNLYQIFAFIDTAVDPKSLAFACLVKSIDGKEETDINDNRLHEIAGKIDQWATKAERDAATDSAKKKMERALRYYYPEHSESDGEGLALMTRMLRRRIERIQNGDDLNEKDPELERLHKRLRMRIEPTNYLQYERQSDVAFEQGCLAITGELHKDAKRMTVMEYHAAIKLLEERAKEMDRAKNRK